MCRGDGQLGLAGQRDAQPPGIDAVGPRALGQPVGEREISARGGRDDQRRVDADRGVVELQQRLARGVEDVLGDGDRDIVSRRRGEVGRGIDRAVPVGAAPRPRLQAGGTAAEQVDAREERHGDLAGVQRRHPRVRLRMPRVRRAPRHERAMQPDDLEQPTSRQRLAHRAQDLQPVGARGRLRGPQHPVVQPAGNHDRGIEAALGDVAQELDAVHARHVEVDDDDVGFRLPGQQRERALTILGLQQAAGTEVGEDLQHRATLELVILDDHHGAVGERHRGSSLAMSGTSCSMPANSPSSRPRWTASSRDATPSLA